MTQSSLYERLGGVFPVAPSLITSAIRSCAISKPAGAQRTPSSTNGSTDEPDGSPGLKFMRTLRVCDIAGGPQVYAATKHGSTQLGLEMAHRVRPCTK